MTLPMFLAIAVLWAALIALGVLWFWCASPRRDAAPRHNGEAAAPGFDPFFHDSLNSGKEQHDHER